MQKIMVIALALSALALLASCTGDTQETSSRAPSEQTSSAVSATESNDTESISEESVPEAYLSLTYTDLHGNGNPAVWQNEAALSAASYEGGTVVRMNAEGKYLFVPDFDDPLCGMEYDGAVHLFAYRDGVVYTAKADGTKVVTDTVELPEAVQNVEIYCQMTSGQKGYVLICNTADDGTLHIVNTLKTATGGKQWNATSEFDDQLTLSAEQTVSFVQFFDNNTAVLACTGTDPELDCRTYVSTDCKYWKQLSYQLEYPYWVPEDTVYNITDVTYESKKYLMTVEIPYRDQNRELVFTSSNLTDWALYRDSYVNSKTEIVRGFVPENLGFLALWEVTNNYFAPKIECSTTRDGMVLYISDWDEYIYLPDGSFAVTDEFYRLAMLSGEDVLLFSAAEDSDGMIQVLRLAGTELTGQTVNCGIRAKYIRLRGSMFDQNTGVLIASSGREISMLWTHDGGKTWTRAETGDASALVPDGFQVDNVQFFDQNKALIAWSAPVETYDEEPDRFVLTADGGKTWKALELPLPNIGAPYGASLEGMEYSGGVYVMNLHAVSDFVENFQLQFSSADLATWSLMGDIPERPAELTRDYDPPNLDSLTFYEIGWLQPDETATVLYASDRGGAVLHVPAWNEYIYLPYSMIGDWYGFKGGISDGTLFLAVLTGNDMESYGVRIVRIGKTVSEYTLLENLAYYEPGIGCYMFNDLEGYLILSGIPEDANMDREIAFLLWTEDGGLTWTVRGESFARRNWKEGLSIYKFFDKNTFVLSSRYYINEALEVRTIFTTDGGKTWKSFNALPYGEGGYDYTEIMELGIKNGKYWMRAAVESNDVRYMEFYSDDLINWADENGVYSIESMDYRPLHGTYDYSSYGLGIYTADYYGKTAVYVPSFAVYRHRYFAVDAPIVCGAATDSDAYVCSIKGATVSVFRLNGDGAEPRATETTITLPAALPNAKLYCSIASDAFSYDVYVTVVSEDGKTVYVYRNFEPMEIDSSIFRDANGASTFVRFFGSGRGIAAFAGKGSLEGRVFYTLDGGLTWSNADGLTSVLPSGLKNPEAVWVSGGTTAFSLTVEDGSKTYTFLSADLKTWTYLPAEFDGRRFTECGGDASVFWTASGSDRVVYVPSWGEVHAFAGDNMLDCALLKEGLMLFTSYGLNTNRENLGIYLLKKGASNAELQTACEAKEYEIAVFDESTAYFLSDRKNLYRTTDGGKTWSAPEKFSYGSNMSTEYHRAEVFSIEKTDGNYWMQVAIYDHYEGKMTVEYMTFVSSELKNWSAVDN